MGYYTYYELDYTGEIEVPAALIEEASKYGAKISPLVDHVEGITQVVGYNPFTDQTKWYDHEKDMKTYSQKYPEVLFILSGEGEESGDIWRKYFKNGRVQTCKAKITFDEFDESKLK